MISRLYYNIIEHLTRNNKRDYTRNNIMLAAHENASAITGDAVLLIIVLKYDNCAVIILLCKLRYASKLQTIRNKQSDKIRFTLYYIYTRYTCTISFSALALIQYARYCLFI